MQSYLCDPGSDLHNSDHIPVDGVIHIFTMGEEYIFTLKYSFPIPGLFAVYEEIQKLQEAPEISGNAVNGDLMEGLTQAVYRQTQIENVCSIDANITKEEHLVFFTKHQAENVMRASREVSSDLKKS